MDRKQLLERCLDLCIKEKKLLKQSEFTDRLKISVTQIRSLLGTAGTMERIMRSYLSFDRDGKLLSEEFKLDIKDSHEKHVSNEMILLANENRKLRRRLELASKNTALDDRIISLAQDSIHAFPNHYIPRKHPRRSLEKKYGKGNRTLLLVLSDFHGGSVINKEEMGGLNEYNLKIMVKRFQYLIDYVLHKIKKYGNINTMTIALLGDMVSGDIHEELTATNELNVIESTFSVASLISQGILDLAQAMKSVKVIGVVGNHGRIKRKKHYKQKYINWDYVVYKSIETALQEQENIECAFPKSFFIVESVVGKNFLFLHGDDIRSWNGIPWYGINRATDKLDDALKYINKGFESIFLGHFHNTGQIDKSIGEQIVNGSLCGADEFALGRLFSVSKPKQLFMCVHEQHGLDWRVPVALDKADDIILDRELRYRLPCGIT